MKKKKVTVGPGTKKRKVTEKEPDSGAKIRKVEEVEKSVTREERNGTLRTQEVLSGRVFNSRIFEKLNMVELVKDVKH